MSSFEICGGKRLKGQITPQGAKNEALQVICAVLLTRQPVTISNIPEIRDVIKLIDLLKLLGVKVEKTAEATWRFTASDIQLDILLTDEFRKKSAELRGSIMIIGPLLARFGKAFIPQPGGDKIGRRRLDTHFIGLEKLGAKFDYNFQKNYYSVVAERLEGTYMLLDEASVTGTANVLMAATLASGTTTIFNAACEPYVVQLCKMLNSMGARIEGIGSNLLTVQGVEVLMGCSHRLLPDMIEVGSFIGLAALTQSNIKIAGVNPADLGIIPDVFGRLGIRMQLNADSIEIPEQEGYEIETFMDGSIMTISDAPWPGFTPDLISIALVVAIQAKAAC